jgi:hypothetical protein
LSTKAFDKRVLALLTSLAGKDWERGHDFAHAFSERLVEILKDYGKPEQPEVPMIGAR